jgi:hypothetical protein
MLPTITNDLYTGEVYVSTANFIPPIPTEGEHVSEVAEPTEPTVTPVPEPDQDDTDSEGEGEEESTEEEETP